MAWGFRKSFKLAPGLQLNLGRRGAGVSTGPKGVKLSVNSRRQKRLSVSRFGTFWRKRL